MELIIGAIYHCADGSIRKLNKIEEDYLWYALPVGDGNQRIWMDLGRTYRWQVEEHFIDGTIITEEEIQSKGV